MIHLIIKSNWKVIFLQTAKAEKSLNLFFVKERLEKVFLVFLGQFQFFFFFFLLPDPETMFTVRATLIAAKVGSKSEQKWN